IPRTRRYRVTDFGFRAALTITRAYNRVLRPSLAAAHAPEPAIPSRLREAVDRVDAALERVHRQQDLAA
ncbi:MAG TPA: hypothetical protein RMH99_14955, partial [Sandaracinaceae bacterium LLY-WYZ-13_1]|nr:hypothetical protein [Sandaracinaceae bacterium LLY-WYZ-13_1]